MYAAFNTLKLELERLLLLRDSITISGRASIEKTKLHQLNLKIYSHERAIKMVVNQHKLEQSQLLKAMKDRRLDTHG